MSRTAMPLTLSPLAADILRHELDALAGTSPHVHHRRAQRIAVTVRPCLRARTLPQGQPIALEAWRLLALSHRWCQGRSGPRRRILMAVYQPTIDLPGTGRITLRCERVVDLTSRDNPDALDPAVSPADARAAVLLHQAVVDATAHDLVDTFELPEACFLFDPDRPPVLETTFPEADWQADRTVVDGRIAYPAWRLARPDGQRWDVHPADGSDCPFEPGETSLTEGMIRGGWIVRDGAPVPMAQRPDRVVAVLGARGCVVRNPAFAVLQGFGLLDPERGYRAWLDTIARPSSQGWIVPDPDHPATPAGRFRRVLADYALADLDAQGRSLRLDALMADLRHGCQAVGVPVPDESALAHDRLLELLNGPWDRVPIPDLAPIQVLDRSGDSANGLAAVRFRNGWTEVDLEDLGDHGGRYQPAAPAAIQAALTGTSRRAGTRHLGRAGAVR